MEYGDWIHHYWSSFKLKLSPDEHGLQNIKEDRPLKYDVL